MASRLRRGEHWSTRVFRSLLALYPRELRDEYGREMTLLFADRYQSATNTRDRALLWLDSLSGLLKETPKEHCRMIFQDLRYAVRTLRRNLLFASTIVLTLALGIGANSAIFSLLNAVVLRQLPVANPEELFVVRDGSSLGPAQRFSWPMFEHLRRTAPAIAMAAMSRVAQLHASIGETTETEMSSVQLVSGEYFSVLKVATVIGRPLAIEDNRAMGAHPVAVISHGYWQRRFGGSPGIVGKELMLNGVRFTIIGVATEGFSGVWLESPVEAWIPLAMQHEVRYSQNFSASSAKTTQPWMPQERIWWLEVIVRSAPEATAVTATKLNSAVQQWTSRDAGTTGKAQPAAQKKLVLEPFGTGFSALRQRFAKPLYVLMAMAALVLLIACANAANLLLARAAGRQREIAVRLSLGAGRMRLVQQLLTEGLLLVVVAGVAALLIARWAGDVLVRMATATATGPAPFTAAVDLRVLAFTAALALATGLLFGLVPALRSTKVELAATLKSAARGVAGGPAMHARALVVLQIALSLVLVAGTGLLVRSFRNLLTLDLGFEQEHVLSIAINARLMGYPSERIPELHHRLLERVGAVPGVRSTAIAMCGLISGCRSLNDGILFEGYQSRPGEQPGFLTNVVSAGYFSTVGMRLLDGRPLDNRDTAKAPRVAVVNEALVRRYFSGRRAIGQRFGEGKLDTQIIGIVRDARVLNVREQAEPMAFFPIHQLAAGTIEVRTIGEPIQMMAAVRRAITEAEPKLPIMRITTLAEQVSRNLSQDRLILSLTSAFGALALGLASFGLFGILSYAVARRTPEFGIRIALGASQGRVIWSVVREALFLFLAGLAIGLPVVVGTTRLMGGMLFEVSPYDWTSLLGATGVLLLVASAAGLFPAWRASCVDPMVALRQD